ncbi:beta strand repeat-containing protein [Pseudomonadota bacterium]
MDGTSGTADWESGIDDYSSTWSVGVELADIDGDGDLDAAGTHPCCNSDAMIFENIGSVTAPVFKVRTDWGVGWSISNPRVFLPDLDGDGDSELLGEDAAVAYLYRNDSVDEGMAVWTDISGSRASWLPTTAGYITTMDVNGDHLPDAFVTDVTDFVTHIYYHVNTTTVVYPEYGVTDGTYESEILDFGSHAGFNTLSYTSEELNSSSLTIKVRGGNTASSPGAWPQQWTTVANNGDLSATFDSYRYLQYQVLFSAGTGNNYTPILKDITFSYDSAALEASVESSHYDTENNKSVVSGLNWTQSLAENTDVRVQIRTADGASGEPVTWTDWVGPDGFAGSYWNSTNDFSGGCSDSAGAITCTTLPVILRNSGNNRWLQYKVTLLSDGSATATFSDISISYATAATSTAIEVTPVATPLSTTEGGASTSFLIRPASYGSSTPVGQTTVVEFQLSDPTEGRLSVDSVTFLPSESVFTGETITVYPVDDDIDDSNISYTIYTSAAISNDATYDNIEVANIAAINVDDETGGAGFTVSPVNGLTVDETGTQTTFDVTPDIAPTQTVTVQVVSSDAGEASVSPSELTFSSGVTTSKTVTITGVDDQLLDNAVTFNIQLLPAVSADSNFDGIDPADVEVTTTDDDTVDLVISGGPFSTSEDGEVDLAFIKLNAAPSADVTVDLSASDGSEGYVWPTSLTFSSTNWGSNKMVYIYGINDNDIDGSVVYSIQTSPFESDDGAFSGIDPQDISVTNVDNDSTPSVTVLPTTGLETSEDGGVASFRIELGTKPTHDVIFSLSTNLPTEVSVPSTVVIESTITSWTGKHVWITGLDDAQDDYDQSFEITGTYTSLDGNYASGTISPLSGINRSTNTTTFEVDQAGAGMGRSVAFADVNGDGNPDLIVGAPGHTSNTGKMFVYHGTGSSYSSSFDQSVSGEATNNYFGHSVANAGDLNNDGYEDVIVGAYGYGTNKGAVYIYRGSSGGLITTPDKTIYGAVSGDYFGYSVDGNANVNSDDYDDVIVGAYGDTSSQGKAHVYHGASSIGAMAEDWSKVGSSAGESFGYTVAFVGNADGSNGADAIIGAPTYNNGNVDEGRAYLFVSTGGSGLDTTALWTKESDVDSARFGEVVSSAGDIDNDGRDDVVVGAPNYNNGHADEGAVYAYHGNASTGLDASHSILIESDQAGALLGSALAKAGDSNGDGYGDVLVGAPSFNSLYSNEGVVYIYPGSSGTLSSTAIVSQTPNQADANFGVAVAGSIDFDNNGVPDYAVGANLFDNPDADEGRVFVYRKPAEVDGITVVANLGNTTTESGGYVNFGVSLDSPPSADVTIVLTSDDTTEGQVSKGVLSFTPSNWDSVQIFTVTGQDDSADDEHAAYNINFMVTSPDTGYDGLSVTPVALTNNDDETTVSVVVADGSASEGLDTGSVTFFRTDPLDSDLIVYYGLSGSAAAVTDYVGPNGVVTIPAGSGSATVTVTANADSLDESDETATMTINSHASYFIGSPSSANVTIVDRNNTVSVGVSDGSVGEAGLDEGVITFSRTAPFDSALTVNYTISGTATPGSDYTALSGSAIIGASDNSVAVNIVPLADDVDENSESVSVEITSSVNYLIGTATAAVNISDDDTAGITVNPASGLEVTEAGGIDTFTIVLNSEPTSDVAIGLSSNDATEGDVTPASLTFTSGNWNVARTVTVVGRDDLIVDTDQNFSILTAAAVSSDAFYSGVDADNVSVSNIDDDVWPNITVTANDATVMENSGTSSFVVNRTGPTTANLTVNYTMSGAAINGTDYGSLSGNVVIGIGLSSATVTVSPTNDGDNEGAETIILSINNDANYVVDQPGSATITIIDDEAPLTPIANFAVDQVVEEGDSAVVTVYLVQTQNIVYPVTIPYTVAGTASGADHTAASNSLVISNPNVSGTINFTTTSADGADADETVTFTMGTLTNAEVGGRSVHTVTLAETNVAPIVKLNATQGGQDTRLVITGDGNVVITSIVDDPNVSDTQAYNWSASNNSLIDIDGNTADGGFTFDPSGLGAGFYNASLTVTDSGSLDTVVEMLLEVRASAPVLTAADTDGDGVNDNVESSDDQDKDGIPDYLDSSEFASNELQVSSSNPDADSYVMQADAGLTLRLGDVAFAAGADGAEVTADDIINYGDNEGGSVVNGDDTLGSVVGYFDFEVADLGELGQTVQVVLPMLQAIPAEAVYRKYDTGVGWYDFVVDADNSIASAAGSPGECPPPGDAAYIAGMTEGHYCLQLSIEDGGPNDTDGVANYVVEDPGKVVSLAVVDEGEGSTPNTVTTPDTGSDPETGSTSSPSSSEGGGAMHLGWLLLAYVLMGWCRSRRFQ